MGPLRQHARLGPLHLSVTLDVQLLWALCLYVYCTYICIQTPSHALMLCLARRYHCTLQCYVKRGLATARFNAKLSVALRLQISVTSGVVSRIEVTPYVHGATELLAVQVGGRPSTRHLDHLFNIYDTHM